MTRQTKTPRQRAEEALGIEERRVNKLRKKRDQLQSDLDAVKAELTTATKRRDFLAQHPDLPPRPSITNQAGDTTP